MVIDKHICTLNIYQSHSTNNSKQQILFSDTNSTIRPIVRPCRVNKALPTNDIYQCKEPDVVFQQWSAFLPFKHNDKQVLYLFH